MPTPVRYGIAVVTGCGAVLCFFAALRDDAGWLGFSLGGLFAIGCVGMATNQLTLIDFATGEVTREGYLFDCVLIWRARRPLADFSSISFRRTRDPEGKSSIFVGLLPKRGRFVAVRYFNSYIGGRYDAAEDFARRLAADVGLEIVHEDGA